MNDKLLAIFNIILTTSFLIPNSSAQDIPSSSLTESTTKTPSTSSKEEEEEMPLNQSFPFSRTDSPFLPAIKETHSDSSEAEEESEEDSTSSTRTTICYPFSFPPLEANQSQEFSSLNVISGLPHSSSSRTEETPYYDNRNDFNEEFRSVLLEMNGNLKYQTIHLHEHNTLLINLKKQLQAHLTQNNNIVKREFDLIEDKLRDNLAMPILNHLSHQEEKMKEILTSLGLLQKEMKRQTLRQQQMQKEKQLWHKIKQQEIQRQEQENSRQFQELLRQQRERDRQALDNQKNEKEKRPKTLSFSSSIMSATIGAITGLSVFFLLSCIQKH